MATQRLRHLRILPYFAELPYYLWGQVNYDSEGDCKKPTDRQWTWIDLEHRETRQRISVKKEEDQWILSGDDETVARLAMFLIDRSGGTPDPVMIDAAGQWDHDAAVARTLPVRREFEQPALAPFDSHWFWGSWKWIGWYATDFTWVGRWIMHSVVRKDQRAIFFCIYWIKDTNFPEQAAALSYALESLSGEPARSPPEWVNWYEGNELVKGAKERFPEPDLDAWFEDFKKECGQG